MTGLVEKTLMVVRLEINNASKHRVMENILGKNYQDISAGIMLEFNENQGMLTIMSVFLHMDVYDNLITFDRDDLEVILYEFLADPKLVYCIDTLIVSSEMKYHFDATYQDFREILEDLRQHISDIIQQKEDDKSSTIVKLNNLYLK